MLAKIDIEMIVVKKMSEKSSRSHGDMRCEDVFQMAWELHSKGLHAPIVRSEFRQRSSRKQQIKSFFRCKS